MTDRPKYLAFGLFKVGGYLCPACFLASDEWKVCCDTVNNYDWLCRSLFGHLIGALPFDEAMFMWEIAEELGGES